MTCDRCQELFSDYFDKELSAEESTSVASHIEECADCRSEFDLYSQGLHSLQESGSVEASGRFATDLLTSLKMEAVSPGEEPPSMKRGFIGGGIAALVTLSFIGGLLMRPSSSDQVRDVVREIEVPSRGEEWESIPREMERAVLRKLDLVKYRGHWVSREMRDGFVSGQVCVAGRMMAPEAAFEEFSQDGEEEAPSVEESLKKLGYEKTSGGYVPQEWLTRWNRGEIQIAPGKWKTQEEFRIYLSGAVVGRPEGVSDNEISEWIDGLRIGSPVRHGNVTLYPLLRAEERDSSKWGLVHQNPRVKIEEIGDPFAVQIFNGSEQPLLLLSGEILVGGKFSRMVRSDIEVSAGDTVLVPVVCVEPDADRKETLFLPASGGTVAPLDVRRAALSGKGQGAIWSALSSLKEHRGKDLSTAFVDFPDRFPGVVGVAVAFGEQLVCAELFQDADLFARRFSSLLKGLSQGISVSEAEVLFSNNIEGVRQLLQSPYYSRMQIREASFLLKQGTRMIGEAYPEGGEIIHLSLLAGDSSQEGKSVAYSVPEFKMKAVLDGVMRQITQGGEFSRIRAIQSLTLFDSPAAIQRLISLLKHSDPVIRKFTVLSLSEGGDASAVPALLEYAKTLERHFPETERVLVALARLGDARALPLFLSWLDGEARRVRLVLNCLPTLVLKIEDRDSWTSVIERLVSCFQDSEGKKWPSQEKARISTEVGKALHQLCGKQFSNASEAAAWWADESSRNEFLEEREKRQRR